MRKEYSDARKSCKKLASRTGRRHFVREGRSDARESGQKLASRTGKGDFVLDGGGQSRWGNMVWEMYGE